MKSASSNHLDAVVYKAYCDRHTPSDWRRENDVEFALSQLQADFRFHMKGRIWPDSQADALSLGTAVPVHSTEGADEGADDATGNKRKRGQPAKSWRLPSGAPVVPHAVYQNVESTLSRFNIQKRKEFVQDACKYWTLKREARRGAALLKRLQLQMEAFSSMEITRRNFAGMGAAGRPRLKRRIDFAEQLKNDMAQVLRLTELVKDREAKYLEDAKLLESIVNTIYLPIPTILQPILDRAQR